MLIFRPLFDPSSSTWSYLLGDQVRLGQWLVGMAAGGAVGWLGWVAWTLVRHGHLPRERR